MKLWLKILLGLIVTGLAAAVLVYQFYYNKPHKNYEKEKPALSVRAKQLFTEYLQNQPLADKKYLDKLVEIEGTIMRVETVGSLVVVVFAYQVGPLGDEGIRVTMLESYNEGSKKLNVFRPVKLKGVCQGYNGTDVIFEKGSITSYGKGPRP